MIECCVSWAWLLVPSTEGPSRDMVYRYAYELPLKLMRFHPEELTTLNVSIFFVLPEGDVTGKTVTEQVIFFQLQLNKRIISLFLIYIYGNLHLDLFPKSQVLLKSSCA